MSRVTISMKAARALATQDAGDFREREDARRELREAIAWAERVPEPKRKPRKPRGTFGLKPSSYDRMKPDPKAAQKREHRAAIREAVFKRAGGRCEGPGPEAFSPTAEEYGRCPSLATDLLHIFGRGKGRRPESERNCLAACRTCHDMETRNHPDGTWWWDFFAEKLADFGFYDESGAAWKRAQFERTRSMLGAGLKERHRAKAEEKIQELENKVHKAVFGEENQR